MSPVVMVLKADVNLNLMPWLYPSNQLDNDISESWSPRTKHEQAPI